MPIVCVLGIIFWGPRRLANGLYGIFYVVEDYIMGIVGIRIVDIIMLLVCFITFTTNCSVLDIALRLIASS